MRTDGCNGYPLEPADFKGAAEQPSLDPVVAISSRVTHGHRRLRRAQQEEKPIDRYQRQLRELRAAGGFLEHEFPRQNVMLTAQRHFEDGRVARGFIRELKRCFGQQQKRDGYPRWHFEVLETTCGVHNHLVGPLTMARAEQLLGYTFDGVAYGQFIDIQQIVPARGGMRGLIGYGAKNPGYLGKELGQKYLLHGGGDKIRFSDAFRVELVERGLITDRIRIYTSRTPPAVTKPKPVLEIVVNDTPPPAKPVQLAFTFDAPVMDIRVRLEAARRERGLSQSQLAAVMGMKQPHYSNAVVRRRDRLGAYARRRALEWLAA